MEFAIIAAGEGSRLREEGYKFSKPMVVLNDMTLVERLVSIFQKNGATKIHIVINEFFPELAIHLQELVTTVPLNVIVKTTPSSLHSFFELLSSVTSNKICVTTVDTVFNEVEFQQYITAFRQDKAIDGLMAATTFIDDESPLFIATDDVLNITGFYDDQPAGVPMVSGGIYCLTNRVYRVVEKAVANGSSRMRNFQRLMISEGLHLKAYSFSKIIDIDHVSDIRKAQDFLSQTTIAAEAAGQ